MADVGSGPDHVYRVDRFVVPEAARGEFLTRSAIKAMHAAMDFDPRRMFAGLGIEAEPGSYRRVDP